MPVRSRAQQQWLAFHRPDLLHKWAAEFGIPKNLPEHVKDKQVAHVGFQKLEGQLAQRSGVTNPGALTAFIGRKKFGNAQMQGAAKKGKPLADADALTKQIHAKRKRRGIPPQFAQRGQ